jgi:hypothetical protein
MMEGIMRVMIVRMIMRMMVRMMVQVMEKKCINELSSLDMYACPQIDTCHVGSYFDPLVPKFRT